MKYEGKLYGKIGNKYIPLKMHSTEVDKAKSDSERLEWLITYHFSLSAVKEDMGESIALWWQVTDGDKSVSGHPLGDARDAIDAAIKRHYVDRVKGGAE